MDRIALQILEENWKRDASVLQRAAGTLAERLKDSTDSRWPAAAFEINRIYNILEKAFERLCEAFENHLEKTGRYHDTLIERVTLDLKGIRPAFLPTDAVRDVRELKGFRHLFCHGYDLDLDPVRVAAAAENATRCARAFDHWCEAFLATVRDRYGDEHRDVRQTVISAAGCRVWRVADRPAVPSRGWRRDWRGWDEGWCLSAPPCC